MEFRFPVFLLFFFPVIVSAAELEEVFTESVVIFNTICAKCHEAECSGRMSFHRAYEESVNHIVRHYNEASGKLWMQKQLYLILNHMKEKCAYYPMKVAVPPQRNWGREVLDKLATLQEKNYFIPVGSFDPGEYQLTVTLKEDARVTIHMVSEEFDMVVEDCYQTKDKQIVIPFTIDEASDYYVRLYPRESVSMTQLVIGEIK
jgi:hypothetical protein